MNSNAHWNDPWLEFSAFKIHLHTLWIVGSASFAAWSVLRTKILLTHYSAFYPQPGIYLYLCQSLSLFLIFLFHTHTHTHTLSHTFTALTTHMRTHARTHTTHNEWPCLPGEGPYLIVHQHFPQCSAGWELKEKWRGREMRREVDKLPPGMIPNVRGEERRGDTR